MNGASGRALRKRHLDDVIIGERGASLIVNAHARRGASWYRQARKHLDDAGFKLVSSYEIKDPVRLPEVVAHAVDNGAKLVIIGGGDGTVSSVVDYLAKRNVVLGILPLGTGNSFARTIGIPLSLEGAIDTVINGKVVDVDLGVANDDYFANIASIGFNARVVHTTPNALKKRFGVFAYLITGLRELARTQPFRCELEMDGHTYQFDHTSQLIVANGAFYGVSRITTSASADDRVLRVCVLNSEKKSDIVRFWWGLIRGNLAGADPVRVFKSKQVVIRTEPQLPVDIDGELTASTPITIGLAPQSLLVMAPPDFVDK